jgi:hypothetical protein
MRQRMAFQPQFGHNPIAMLRKLSNDLLAELVLLCLMTLVSCPFSSSFSCLELFPLTVPWLSSLLAYSFGLALLQNFTTTHPQSAIWPLCDHLGLCISDWCDFALHMSMPILKGAFVDSVHFHKHLLNLIHSFFFLQALRNFFCLDL